MWVTLSSGEIVPKDEAANRMLGRVEANHRSTLSLGRRAYLGEIADGWRPLQQETCKFVEYADREIRRLLAEPNQASS
jgi:streptomycin 3"-adenylyltransferase